MPTLSFSKCAPQWPSSKNFRALALVHEQALAALVAPISSMLSLSSQILRRASREQCEQHYEAGGSLLVDEKLHRLKFLGHGSQSIAALNSFVQVLHVVELVAEGCSNLELTLSKGGKIKARPGAAATTPSGLREVRGSCTKSHLMLFVSCQSHMHASKRGTLR